MRLLIQHAGSAGVGVLHGTTLAENWSMLALAAKEGFDLIEHSDPGFIHLHRALTAGDGAGFPASLR
jgi:hypothetical protein